eukprot:Gb_04047 [translate_table: standard]
MVADEDVAGKNKDNKSNSCDSFLQRTCCNEPAVKEALHQWPKCSQIISELRKQQSIGLPIAAMNIMWFGRMVISAAFLGRLGEVELAGGTLALTFANVTGFSILTGLSGGMEPLCGQAFGAGKHKLIGLTLYWGILLLLLASIPIGLLWCNVEKLLLFSGQDKDISEVARIYLLFLLPDLVATAILAPLRIYLRSQCITKPMMISSAIALFLHIPINIALQKLGVAGTALAVCWSDLNLIIMLLIYIYKDGLHRATHEEGWWKRNSEGWIPLVKLSIPSCLMTCLEWWCYEILVLITGRLPKPEEAVSILAIVLNADQMLYALQLSLASCASTRVGNELGGNRPVGAYHAAVVSLGLSVGIACIGGILMIAARNVWGILFTKDEGVVHGVAKLLAVMGVMEVFNFPQTVSGGVLRGTARPSMAVYVNLGAFYLLGLPLGTALAFRWKFGLLGLFIGLFVAVTVCAALTVTAVLGTDWIQQTLLAQNLTNNSDQFQCKSRSVESGIKLSCCSDSNISAAAYDCVHDDDYDEEEEGVSGTQVVIEQHIIA